MKLLSAFLLLSTVNAWAQPEQGLNYEQLKNRFITTVKEARIDGDFLQVPQVRECLEKNTITLEELKTNSAAVKKKQKDSAQCLRDKFKDLDPAAIEELGRKLELQPYGIVKGTSSGEIVNYFANRLATALYGKGNDGKPQPLRLEKMVDQKVFADLYESQLGKNILLEISQYCAERLHLVAGAGSPNRFDDIAKINLSDTTLAFSWTDIPPASSSSSTPAGSPPPDVFEKFMTDVFGVSSTPPRPEVAKNRLGAIFDRCTGMIPILCKQYEGCSCRYKKSQDPSFTCDDSAGNSCPAGVEPTAGRHSCHVFARLRGYRVNLEGIKVVQGQLREVQDQSDKRMIGRELHKRNEYDASRARDGETVDDLTSLTSTDVDQVIAKERIKREEDAFQRAQCEQTPENPECERFLYTEEETLNFANASIGYQAATELELKKISDLAEDEKKLETFLMTKGYFELAEELKNGKKTSTQVVEAARQKFETEREATFKEMEAAFERKQVVANNGPRTKQQKTADIKADISQQGDRLKRLMHFNNVVTSFMQVKKRDASGKETDAGSNIRALERELRTAQSSGQASDSLKFFSDLASAAGSSSISSTESPLVDLTFLDSILGKEEAQKEQANRKASPNR